MSPINPEKLARIDERITPLLAVMTLEEKAGQLNQYGGSDAITGPTIDNPDAVHILNEIREGGVGSFLNVVGVDKVTRLQRIAVEESRLKIPLIFGFDVIHGYFTTFPVPLGEAATWDPALMERSARISAIEASSDGVQWTFAPMVDICRDARWGRVMEGGGEDTFLGSVIAAARVRGFQGGNLSSRESIGACVKHFAAYGWAEAGREYNTADVSEHVLRNVILPPFKAAIDAGAVTVMNGFHEVSGVPCTGHHWLNTKVLKEEWGFKGFMVSDYSSYIELVKHGYALDGRDAARIGINAGSEMDMGSRVVGKNLPDLVRQGLVAAERLDDAVRRILRVKFLLGLFDDPYQGITHERRAAVKLHPDHRAAARETAAASFVLLKNDGAILPITPGRTRIAVIGELAQSRHDMMSSWAACGEGDAMASLKDGLAPYAAQGTDITFVKGCDREGRVGKDDLDRAVTAAGKAELVILALGEHGGMSGECQSRVDPSLPGDQLLLARAIRATGVPVVIVLFSGRPLVIPELAAEFPCILAVWFGGQEAGHAMCDVLFGVKAPQGRLPSCFPRATGQLPLYYAAKNTGRPQVVAGGFGSKFNDCPNSPLFQFGYGLTYTTFRYDETIVEQGSMKRGGSVTVRTVVTNTGEREGTETVQLYVRDLVGSYTRPVRELKGFCKVTLKPGEKQEVRFELREKDLAFWTANDRWEVENGEFEVFVGADADAVPAGNFVLS